MQGSAAGLWVAIESCPRSLLFHPNHRRQRSSAHDTRELDQASGCGRGRGRGRGHRPATTDPIQFSTRRIRDVRALLRPQLTAARLLTTNRVVAPGNPTLMAVRLPRASPVAGLPSAAAEEQPRARHRQPPKKPPSRYSSKFRSRPLAGAQLHRVPQHPHSRSSHALRPALHDARAQEPRGPRGFWLSLNRHLICPSFFPRGRCLE